VYRRILVPVDGSHPAQLREAIHLAAAGAELLLLYVAEDAPPPAAGATEWRGFGTRERFRLGYQVLADALATARRMGAATEAAVIGRAGQSTGEAIVAEARQWGADLIVLGTHGDRDRGPGLQGSVVAEVIGDAPSPVLVVRAAGRPSKGTPTEAAAAAAPIAP
jgi:nucleotide-binding universal stress UspA family protein